MIYAACEHKLRVSKIIDIKKIFVSIMIPWNCHLTNELEMVPRAEVYDLYRVRTGSRKYSPRDQKLWLASNCESRKNAT